MLNFLNKIVLTLFALAVPISSFAAPIPEDFSYRARIIDQLIFVGLDGYSYEEGGDFARVLSEANVGGIVLFDYDSQEKNYKKNIQSPYQLRKLISDLQSHAQTPLFIAVDEEGGAVSRLKARYGFSPLSSARVLGTRSPFLIKKQSRELASDLHDLGINFNFAPSVDVDVNKKSPAIGLYGRSFSFFQTRVTSSARAFIQGHKQELVITSIKHFPGHGSSTADSHKGFTDITNTYKERELYPFRILIKENNADSVMVAHVVNKSVDPVYPASLSSIFVTDMLRGDLGFEGLVVTDDLDMKALTDHYTFEEKTVGAIKAGVDMLIYSNNIDSYDASVVVRARNAIDGAVQRGDISWDRILESYNRVQDLKQKYKIIQ